MSVVRFSKRAEADLDEIASFTYQTWGEAQITKYLNALENFCALLARNPKIGRSYSNAHPTWRRMEHTSHVVLYRQISGGIFVQRVLHKRMLPERHGL